MIKEVKYAGLSSVPGDYECADGELAVAIDVVNENGEIKPFLHPEPFMSVIGKLMFVHKGSGYENFITVDREGLYTQTRTSGRRQIASDIGKVIKIEASGNTLTVVSENKPVTYFLFKDEVYKELGHKPPELNISFGLQGEVVSSDKFSLGREMGYRIAEDLYEEFGDSVKDAVTDIVLGQVNKYIREEATDKGRFMAPFFVRAAYRMYDGSLLMHSAPVLMMPSAGDVPLALITEYGNPTRIQITAVQCRLDLQVVNYAAIAQRLVDCNHVCPKTLGWNLRGSDFFRIYKLQQVLVRPARCGFDPLALGAHGEEPLAAEEVQAGGVVREYVAVYLIEV